MLCNECNEQDATIHLTQIMGDETIKRHLCEVCGKDLIAGISAASAKRFPQRRIPIQTVSQGSVPPVWNPEPSLNTIIAGDARYAKDAYSFVLEAVHIAFVKDFPGRTPRHISAAELLEVLRLEAIDAFGASAKSKLQSWGVSQCEDFGEIVFNLVEAGLLTTRPEDRKEDFKGGYDFDKAFPD
jgi:uncharacterized repeat protein (TIGR04138 family)